MKHSFRAQIIIVFTTILAIVMILLIMINTLFLEEYYKAEKRVKLRSIYDYLAVSVEDETIGTSRFYDEITILCNNGNVDLFVMNASHEVVVATMHDYASFQKVFFNYLLGDDTDEQTISTTVDKDTKQEYMDMWGNIDNQYYYVMRTAVESIRESVVISNRFLCYIGLIAVICSCGIIYIVTSKLTMPLRELVNISDRMIHLDFNAKYHMRGNSEVDILGERLNLLSKSLERNISELKKANNELEHDIAKKIEIDQMRQEFISNVSHELKTPIALIQGYAEGLKEFAEEEDLQNREYYCDVIVDEAMKMNKMVQNLLTLSQLEFGNDELSFERFNLTSLISNLLESTRILAGERQIKVEFPEKNDCFVWADEYKIEEVVINYISNAYHYVSGENRIKITFEQKDSCVRVNVFNTGNPIPEEDLEKVWVKFYKVDKSRTREYGGSGIGLSIVKAIMDSHNRSCGVYNCEDGVVFWFEVERVKEGDLWTSV